MRGKVSAANSCRGGSIREMALDRRGGVCKAAVCGLRSAVSELWLGALSPGPGSGTGSSKSFRRFLFPRENLLSLNGLASHFDMMQTMDGPRTPSSGLWRSTNRMSLVRSYDGFVTRGLASRATQEGQSWKRDGYRSVTYCQVSVCLELAQASLLGLA